MSADNYYIIRKHPDGGFAALMGFASDDRMPVIDTDRAYKTFETVDQAVMWASDEYSEYGVSVHPECREYPASYMATFADTTHALVDRTGPYLEPGY